MWGVIGGFGELHRKVASGVENMTYGSISVIQFWTTPKGDIPYYSYICRNPYLLRTELKNVVCSRLGTMLYLYIEKGKEATNKSQF